MTTTSTDDPPPLTNTNSPFHIGDYVINTINGRCGFVNSINLNESTVSIHNRIENSTEKEIPFSQVQITTLIAQSYTRSGQIQQPYLNNNNLTQESSVVQAPPPPANNICSE